MDKITHISLTSLKYKADRINQGDINVLAENIKTYGLRQPLLVTADDGKYMVVDGGRRLAACKKIGMVNIPCIVLTADEVNEDLSLILNTHRLNLNVVELYRMAAWYVKDELKGDPMALPPEKIKMVAAKLNLDIHATCRVLNIGRLSKEIQEFIASGKLPLRLALLITRIPNKKDQDKFCKQCIEDHPSMREALEYISWQVKHAPCRDIDEALFDKEECQSCRHKGHRDRSLFEEPVSEDADENFANNCWNIKCFDEKTEVAWKQAIKEAKEKLGLTGITRKDKYFGGVEHSTVVPANPEKCKTCKQVRLTSKSYKGIFVSCPTTCANIKQTKRSDQETKPKKKDPSKFTKQDKIDVLNERFAVAARKTMVEHFIDTTHGPEFFAKSKTPKNYKRVLFFMGHDACTNPFGELEEYHEQLAKGARTIIDNLDLKGLAKLNLHKAADHLYRYDRSGITPEDINQAIELLYGEKNWCATHYDDIAAKLSKRSKSFLKDIKPWRPSWSRAKKK